MTDWKKTERSRAEKKRARELRGDPLDPIECLECGVVFFGGFIAPAHLRRCGITTEEYKQKHGPQSTATPGYRERKAIVSRDIAEKMWSKPEHRQKLQKIYNEPVWKERAREIAKKKWENPEYREACLSALAKHRTPEFYAEMSERMKIAHAAGEREHCKPPCGPDSPLWRGGTRPRTLFNINGEYGEWRKAVWKRDRGKCRMCLHNGVEKKGRDCHHIYPLGDYPDLAVDVANGVLLCKECHNKMQWHEEECADLLKAILCVEIDPVPYHKNSRFRIRRRIDDLGGDTWLREQYNIRSARDMAKEVGCCPEILIKYMRQADIKIRPPGNMKKRSA